jgi:hypothetical protein
MVRGIRRKRGAGKSELRQKDVMNSVIQ